MNLRVNKVMQLAALSAATTLGLAGQTHAALYQGTWDPLFGAQFAGLGWKASGTLNVTQACEDELQNYGFGGAVSLNAYTAQLFGAYGDCGYGGFGDGGIRLEDVSVEFYDVESPEEITARLFVGTYYFGDGSEYGGSPSIDGETQFLTSIDFYGLVPTAFQTSYSTRGTLDIPEPPVEEEFSRSSLSSSSLCTSATPFTGYQYSSRLGSAPITSGLQYYCDADGNLVGPTGQSSFQPNFVLRNANGDPIILALAQDPARVPEPGTLALAGLALAGAAAARRRKRS